MSNQTPDRGELLTGLLREAMDADSLEYTMGADWHERCRAALTATPQASVGGEEAAFQRGKRTGYTEGFVAGRAALTATGVQTPASEQAARTDLGWQQRAEIAERNWKKCRMWAIAGGAPIEKLGDDPDMPWHIIRDRDAAAPAVAATPPLDPNELIEAVAKLVYSQWVAAPGYVPWVEGGNSYRQDEARRLARTAIESVIEAAATPPAVLPTVQTNKPTRRDKHYRDALEAIIRQPAETMSDGKAIDAMVRIAKGALKAKALAATPVRQPPEDLRLTKPATATEPIRFFWENRPTGAMAALNDVMAERRRQMMVEGWTAKHDDEHDEGDLSAAGSAYALAAADLLHPQSQGDGGFTRQNPPSMWPPAWRFKPAGPRRMLVKAAALLLAEIERIDRAHGIVATPAQQEGETR